MELQVTSFDYCVQKVQIAASFVDADINVVTGLTQAQLVAAHPQARSMVLRHNGEYLAQHNAILRFIANLKPEVCLYGPQGFDTSQVYHLHFSCNNGANVCADRSMAGLFLART